MILAAIHFGTNDSKCLRELINYPRNCNDKRSSNWKGSKQMTNITKELGVTETGNVAPCIDTGSTLLQMNLNVVKIGYYSAPCMIWNKPKNEERDVVCT